MLPVELSIAWKVMKCGPDIHSCKRMNLMMNLSICFDILLTTAHPIFSQMYRCMVEDTRIYKTFLGGFATFKEVLQVVCWQLDFLVFWRTEEASWMSGEMSSRNTNQVQLLTSTCPTSEETMTWTSLNKAFPFVSCWKGQVGSKQQHLDISHHTRGRFPGNAELNC